MRGHAAKLYGHRESARLRVGQAAVGERMRETYELPGLERAAVALGPDRFLRQPHGDALGEIISLSDGM